VHSIGQEDPKRVQPLGAVPAAARRNLRETGGRIERLLEEVRSMASPPAWERVEELLRVVLELYTGGLERILAVVSEQGASAERLLQQLTEDQLVASLLVLHGLHPEDLRSRVQKALVQVRPYLGSHGGDVEIVDADTHSGVVRLRMKGSCDGCPSSMLTVKLAVEGAIRELAPEVTRIEVDGISDAPASAPRASDRHLRQVDPRWVRLELGESSDGGRLIAHEVAGTRILLCRVEGRLYAYRDACPGCGSPLTRGRVVGIALTCPTCSRRYDVRHAGRSLGSEDLHLSPIPLLERETGVEVALGGAAA
jgi:Fe-S cluster biogenesis protein NfuA/nitrite reductase/ring-hydroxylating ferredoxin subunit